MSLSGPRNVLVLGDAADAPGFRLAGVCAIMCSRATDVDRALAQCEATQKDRPGVILVSESVYRLAQATLDALQGATDGPLLLVLPASDGWGMR